MFWSSQLVTSRDWWTLLNIIKEQVKLSLKAHELP